MKLHPILTLLVLLVATLFLTGCVSETVKTAELQFVTHLTAGMPEQDVYIMTEGINENEVVRATLEELASETVQTQMVYASTTFNDHDPFQVSEAPFGPFAKGPELGFTMQEWLAATGSGSYTIQGASAKVDFTFENLIPNGVYTLWCSRVKLPPEPQIISVACGELDGSENTFIADSEGKASISLTTPPLPPTTEARMSVFAIAYHSDGNTYGDYHGDFGRVTHVQALTVIPAPDDEAWQTTLTALASTQ